MDRKHCTSSRFPDYNHGSLYQENTSISPRLVSKLKRIPSNSKMSAPLQYVNLEKYDVGDQTAPPCADNDTNSAPSVTHGKKLTTRWSSSNNINLKRSPLHVDSDIRGKSFELSCRSVSSETKEENAHENDCQGEEQFKSPLEVPPKGRAVFFKQGQVENDKTPTVLQRRPCIKSQGQCLSRKRGNNHVSKRVHFVRPFSASDIQDDDQPNSIILNDFVNVSTDTSSPIREENYLTMTNIPSEKGNASAESEQRRQSKNIAEISFSSDTSVVAIPFPGLMSYKQHLSSNATYKPCSSATSSVHSDKVYDGSSRNSGFLARIFRRNSSPKEPCVFASFSHVKST